MNRTFATLARTLLFGSILFAAPADAAGPGVPSTARAWQGSEYARAAVALAAAGKPLPRHDEREGARLLARLTALDNLRWYRDGSVPLAARLESYLAMQQAVSAIVKLYAHEAATSGSRLGNELARLQAFALHGAALGVQLVAEFMPTLPRDETYETRLAGLGRMSAGLANVFAETAATLGERDDYAEEDLERIVQAMSATLPTILPALPADFREDLGKRLRDRREAFEPGRARSQLEAMVTLLSAG